MPLKEGIGGEREGDFMDNSSIQIQISVDMVTNTLQTWVE
jgi:hypothetical protein